MSHGVIREAELALKPVKEKAVAMPAIVQVKVVSARDLPIMDRSSELTDAFVEVW